MKKGYTKSKQRIALTVLSGIERNRITLGVERAKRLARALQVHPAVILFPDWETEKPWYIR